MKNLSEKGMFISKPESAMLQAVAVMLMVWHHLFGFPERIHVPYVLLTDEVFPFHVETMMSYFGRICIAVFAFVSGYGMRKKAVPGRSLFADYKSILQQLLKFFSRYWIVFFLFIPLGYFMGVYPFDWKRFIKGIVGNGVGYNAEWWYVGTYMRMLLLFPILSRLADLVQKRLPLLIHVLMAASMAALLLIPRSVSFYSFASVLMCFVAGMYFVDCSIFETIYRTLSSRSWLQGMVGLVLVALVFVLRFMGWPDYLTVPLFVFALLALIKLKQVVRLLSSVLMYVGRYSTYIWLTHTFFGYYYFQKLTFFPRYSWLIFLWCMVLSIASGVVMEYLLSWITKGLGMILPQKK